MEEVGPFEAGFDGKTESRRVQGNTFDFSAIPARRQSKPGERGHQGGV